MKMWQGFALMNCVATEGLQCFFPSDLEALQISLQKIEMSSSYESQVLNFNLYFYQPQTLAQVKAFMEKVLKTTVVLFHSQDLVEYHVKCEDPTRVVKQWHGIHHNGNISMSTQAIFQFYQQLSSHLINAFSNIQCQVIDFQKEHALHKNALALLRTEMIAYKDECHFLLERIKDLEITNKNLCIQLEMNMSQDEKVRHLAMTSLNDLYSRMNLMREKQKLELSVKSRQIYILQQQIAKQQEKFQDYAYFLSDQMRSKLNHPFQTLISPVFQFGHSVPIDPPSLSYEIYNFDKQYVTLTQDFSHALNEVFLFFCFFNIYKLMIFNTQMLGCLPVVCANPEFHNSVLSKHIGHKRVRRNPE
jgi:hypothetical protein